MAEDYTYIVARLRALEAAMPERAWFQRLVRAPLGGMLGALREYYKGFEAVEVIAGFEAGIESSKVSAIDLVTSLILDPAVSRFIRAGHDFDNILHMWKAWKLGSSFTLNRYGSVDPEVVENAVAGGDPGLLPDHLKEFLIRLEERSDPDALAMAEYTGEREKWAFLLENAPGGDARRFVRNRIDLINIKTFIRLGTTSLRKTGLEYIWIAGGEIEPGRLAALKKEPEEEFYSFIMTTSYRKLVQRGLGKETPLWRIDPMLRLQLLDMAGESRYRFFDITPVLYYLELVDRDVQALRSVIVGRLNNLPDEAMLERLDALIPS